MAATIVTGINLDNIPKEKIVKGEKGTYIDIVLFVKDQADAFGKNVSTAVSQSKEERQSDAEMIWLGKGKVLATDGVITKAESEPATAEASVDGLPF